MKYCLPLISRISYRVLCAGLVCFLPASLTAQEAGPYLELIELLDKQQIPFNREKAALAARDAVLSAVDPDARVLNAEQAKALIAERDGAFFGPGLRLTYTNRQVRVSGLRPNSPAAAKGLKVGDILESINGSDITRQRFSSLFPLLRGPAVRPLRLGVRTPSNTLLEYDVGQRQYQLDTVELAEEFSAQLSYLRINGLYSDGSGAVVERLKKWNGDQRNGIILDLRDAGGGNLQAAADIAGLFAKPDSLLFTFRDHRGTKLREFYAPSQLDFSVNSPTLVLVNQTTRGAAELLAAVLAAGGRGVMLVGETTYGSPGVREMIDLPNREKVWLAVKTLTLEDGTVYDGTRGIHPDVMVRDLNLSESEATSLEASTNGSSEDPVYLASLYLKERVQYDALLQRAVDILLGLKALNIHLLAR